MEYNFREIEKKWQERWKESGAYKVSNESKKPKYYVLDMFPYPSGSGLHVGHPLGYIASDIFSRYKRLKGFNVLHPMGYDAFGLPAEQYALEHGVHPAVSTEQNIQNFRKQLDNIGFSYDWDREVRTSDPKYYKWTQWIFLQLFKSWFNRATKKAESIDGLITIFEKEGNINNPFPNATYRLPVAGSQDRTGGNSFSKEEWKGFDEKTKQSILMEYRLAYCGYGEVNWCEALGTVLANDEVVNGVSERGGYPVVKKKLRQWYLRITEYADRLLEGLDRIEFSEAMKEMQTNWIGKSYGAEIDFSVRLTPSPSPRGEGGDPDSLSGRRFKTADLDSWKILKQFGRDNRREQTEAEAKLWEALRNSQLGVKVRRQHAIDSFIVDFAVMECNLVIEVDGGYHNEQQQKDFDEARTVFLEVQGFTLLRFTNDEVVSNTEAVLARIKSEIEKIKASSPLLHKEKGMGDEAVLRVYTTRPDTIFGVDFMVIAPEHDLVEKITTAGQKTAVEEYIAYVKSRSERERMAEKKITGEFTGAYAINPFNGREIPVWISEYVLAGYGTGAIMAVPCGDERDFKFAKQFNIPITNIIGEHFNGEEANPTKDAILENSDFLNGTPMRQAAEVVLGQLEVSGLGKRKVNYKMRDAAFSRQRYWGEPFPIKWIDGVAYPLDENELPLELPHVDGYKPGPEGEGPLANIETWTAANLETNTMPGYAGSSWYFLRYMDPHNENAFCDRKVSDYWGQVDLYIGGTEHAVGHLLYSRMWTKALFDLGYIGHDEPYKKLVNQGMITGRSYFFKSVLPEGFSQEDIFIMSENRKSEEFEVKRGYINATTMPVRLRYGHRYVEANGKLTKENFERYLAENDNPNYAPIEWENENGQEYIMLSEESEKMSKSKFNVDNPDDLVAKYGADTFRMYEMFLGPVEMSKPWDTKGIEGVHRFIKKLWRLFYDEVKGKVWTDEKSTDAELKVLHKTIKKIEEDTARFSFNTGVSGFMIAVNELSDLKCNKKAILEQLLILLTPYAPHVSEELWKLLGNEGSILDAAYPLFEAKYVTESSKEYPVSINGKVRTNINIALDLSQPEVEQIVLSNEIVQKWLEGKPHKKIIYVKNKMINVVI